MKRIVHVALSKNGTAALSTLPTFAPIAETTSAVPSKRIRLWKVIAPVFSFASSSRLRDTASSCVVSALFQRLKRGASVMSQSRNMTQME